FGYASPFGDTLPNGTLIVFFRSEEWRTNPTWRKLLAHSEHLLTSGSIHGDSFENDPVVVFRYHHGP
ncbi:MAG TPA: hypothetical protein VGO25_01070, partial [Rhodanobacteraceae bacterium]|nr:hypothetical protein [Rhodanobacteraceae bacterium]